MFRATNYAFAIQKRSGTGSLFNKAKAAGIVVDTNDSNKLKVNLGGTITEVATGAQGLTAPSSTNLILRTALLTNSVRLNSITDSTSTSGDLIGFQSKPRAGVGGSQTLYGCQVGPSISNGIATTGSMIGGHFEVYLRGTSAGTIGGDVRGLQVELVTDDAGTRTIDGNVSAIRVRAAFSATTISGKFTAIRIEKAEAQTNSKNFDAVMELTSTSSLAWHDTDTATGDTEAGYFAVYINGNKRYVQCFSDAPSA